MPTLSYLSEAKSVVKQTFTTLGCPSLIDITSTRWNHRLRTTAGRAIYSNGKRPLIELSSHIWHRFSDVQRYNTTVHEACHIAAPYIFRCRCGHGPNWVRLMNQMNVPAERCHTLKVSHRIRVSCGCPNGCLIGKTQFRYMLQGKRYVCRTCRCDVEKKRGYIDD